MRVLAIETSCDETAIAIVEATGGVKDARFAILGNALLSQVELHKQYGGVFPALAKREHTKNLIPILEAALKEAGLLQGNTQVIPDDARVKISDILARESGLTERFLAFISKYEAPAIDVIAVTAGPGLEPALWVGINFARALAFAWGKPLVAVNHMEGHILAGLAEQRQGDAFLRVQGVALPLLALLVSGGHTELVAMKKWLSYELVGQTRDDAIGEAFDKVARMLSLPYPGGPEISLLAESVRSNLNHELQGSTLEIKLPRPMIREENCDFSFAGLKTAVLYLLKEMPRVSDMDVKRIAHEFENAAADVLWEKTARALNQTGAKTLVIGGGVSANTHIRHVFRENVETKYPHVNLHIPNAALSTDNAIMIALAGYYRALCGEFVTDIRANGTLSLCQKNS